MAKTDRTKKQSVVELKDQSTTTESIEMQGKLILTNRLASIGELASGIAHELNNPLTSVIGFCELLMEKDIPADVKKDLQIIEREAHRTVQIVRNLLAFARVHPPVKQLVNVNSIIENSLELLSYEQKVNNIEVVKRFANLPEIMADYFQLQQVFVNIIINAQYFMSEAHNKGTLTITTEKVGDFISVSFADDGLGISKENLTHIFDPFFTTKPIGKGTGLGLSICYRIVTEHSGRIYVESELGKGATFFVELPINKIEKGGKMKNFSPFIKRVLVVEDEPAICQVCLRVLSSEGLEVDVAANGEAAQDMLNKQSYDICLIDIRTPIMNGKQLYQWINEKYPQLAGRVIFTTGDVIREDTQSFLMLTKRPFIPKPFTPRELKVTFRKALQQIEK